MSAPGSPVPDQLPLGRGSVAWQVNAEPVIFAGGGRALLMQVAHPGVGAGVEQHSTYASDPWGRLFRTVDIMMKLSFGDARAVSARQQRMLAKMHRRVKGTTDDRRGRYSAFDPALQVWVWATLVDTALLDVRTGPAAAVDRRARAATTPSRSSWRTGAARRRARAPRRGPTSRRTSTTSSSTTCA